MGTPIGNMLVRITGDPSGFNAAMTSVETRAAAGGAKLAQVGMIGAAAFAGIGIAAVKMGADFEKGMANVNTLLGGNAQRINELGESVKRLATVTGKDLDDLTGGLYQVVSAFGDSADTAEKLEITAKAAAAGLSTTTEALNLISAVTKGYGDTSAKAAQQSADLAFLTVKLGQTTFPELAASIGRVVPVAAKMGVSVEELHAGFATLTGVTGNAAEVSTQMSGILRAMIKPTDGMRKAIDDLGYSSAEALISDKGMVGAMKALIGTTDGSTVAIGKLFRRAEALTALFALTGGQADVFAEKLAAMGDASGAAAEAFDIQMDTFEGRLSQLTQKISVALTDLGEGLLPIAETVIGAVNNIGRLFGEIGKIFTGIGRAWDELPQGLKDILSGKGPIGARAGQLWEQALYDWGPTGALGWTMSDKAAQNYIAAIVKAQKEYEKTREIAEETKSEVGETAGWFIKIRDAAEVTYKQQQLLIAGMARARAAGVFPIEIITPEMARLLDEAEKEIDDLYKGLKIVDEQVNILGESIDDALDKLGGDWGQLGAGAAGFAGLATGVGEDLAAAFESASGPPGGFKNEWGDAVEEAFLSGFDRAMHNLGDFTKALTIAIGDAVAAGFKKAMGSSAIGNIFGSIGGGLIGGLFGWIGGLFGGGGERIDPKEFALDYGELMKGWADKLEDYLESGTAIPEAIWKSIEGSWKFHADKWEDFTDDLEGSILRQEGIIDEAISQIHSYTDAIGDSNRAIGDIRWTLAFELPKSLEKAKNALRALAQSGELIYRPPSYVVRDGLVEERTLRGGAAYRAIVRDIEGLERGKWGQLKPRDVEDILSRVGGEGATQAVLQLIETKEMKEKLKLQIQNQKEQIQHAKNMREKLKNNLPKMREKLDRMIILLQRINQSIREGNVGGGGGGGKDRPGRGERPVSGQSGFSGIVNAPPSGATIPVTIHGREAINITPAGQKSGPITLIIQDSEGRTKQKAVIDLEEAIISGRSKIRSNSGIIQRRGRR